MIRWMNYDYLNNIFVRHLQIIKYLVVGGFVVVVNLSTLYTFTDIFGIHYLISTVCAFLVSFCVSFFLQKSWTFSNREVSSIGITRQMTLYLCLQASCLALNTSLMYVFVEYMGLWYIASQAIISLIIAIGAFFISRNFIFKSTI